MLEFVVEWIDQSLTMMQKLFKKGLHRRLVEEISMWIKMLMTKWETFPSPIEMEA